VNTPRPRTFLAIVFTVAYSIAYVVAVWKNYALFTYHPVPGTIGMGVEKPQDGPAMYWYGWMATATIAALTACLTAYVVPERLAKRIWPGCSWVIPLGVLLFFAYLLRGYFLR
jgi:hypothetical protein